jgi:hypothetical protein
LKALGLQFNLVKSELLAFTKERLEEDMQLYIGDKEVIVAASRRVLGVYLD